MILIAVSFGVLVNSFVGGALLYGGLLSFYAIFGIAHHT
jgi:hypothetical protein